MVLSVLLEEVGLVCEVAGGETVLECGVMAGGDKVLVCGVVAEHKDKIQMQQEMGVMGRMEGWGDWKDTWGNI